MQVLGGGGGAHGEPGARPGAEEVGGEPDRLGELAGKADVGEGSVDLGPGLVMVLGGR